MHCQELNCFLGTEIDYLVPGTYPVTKVDCP
jgi:hypothetical protein